jgi:hypothetical protein
MMFRRALAFAIVCTCSISQVAAQDMLTSRVLILPPLVPAADGQSAADRMRAVEGWTRDYSKWRAWHERWRNTREPGWFSARPRQEPPVPPDWLASSCALVAEDENKDKEKDWMDAGCLALRQWAQNDDAAEVLAQQVAQVRSKQEAPRHTLWWERVHLDALWVMTQSGSSAFGLAGTHATFRVTDRFQVFMAPGLILMRLPALDGRETWNAATDWGFSFRMFNFKMPAMDRPSTVHFNIARVWVLASADRPVPGELYLAGLSLTFKQR